MNDGHLYNEWKQRRRQIAVPEGFSDRVMAGLLSGPKPQDIKEPSGAKAFLMRWGLSAGLTLLGLIRLSVVTHNLLVP